MESNKDEKAVDEIVLYEEEEKSCNEEKMENSQSDVEMITNEEFLLECARYAELHDLINLIEEDKQLDINYKDFRNNTALRKDFNKLCRYGIS